MLLGKRWSIYTVIVDTSSSNAIARVDLPITSDFVRSFLCYCVPDLWYTCNNELMTEVQLQARLFKRTVFGGFSTCRHFVFYVGINLARFLKHDRREVILLP